MKIYNLYKNPFVLFSPFLILFTILVIVNHADGFQGDESRYVLYAQNILQGFYSTPAPNINLWSGPGYPIILIPFFAFDLPLISITLMNAVFQYLSIVMLFKAMIEFITFRKALLFTLLWALCYSSYSYMSLILTETFTVFLVSVLIFSLVKSFNESATKYLLLSGFIIGYIALTKIIFGYIILLLFVGIVFLWLKNRKSINYRRGSLIMVVAMTTVIPYLTYTYALTNKFYYWGNSGGMSLYWMSNPNEYEYGDWHNESLAGNKIDGDLKPAIKNLKINHQKEIDEVSNLIGIEKDEAYKKIAIKNIKTHPYKYLKNISSNISRSLFGFPVTYTLQRPIIKIWYFSILYTLILLSIIPTLLMWLKIPFSIRFLIVFVFSYLVISSLVSIDNRQFIIVVPILIFWIAFITQKTVSIKIN